MKNDGDIGRVDGLTPPIQAAIRWPAADSEVEQIQVETFLDVLAEVAIAVANRRLEDAA